MSTATQVPPVGASGRVSTVTDGSTVLLICRTVRGQGGWGVHTEDGELIVSGWPTKTRALAFADRELMKRAGGAS